MKEKLKNEYFIGVVEDNKDPKKIGRCKVRVAGVFDDPIPTADIPWASPWKDLNGNQYTTVEIGKIVYVVFEDGDIYKPEFIYAEHFNINLENKLQTLSDTGYNSMRALMMDHKTQIYSNDDEGLIMDYKMNNINIVDSSININLKDNYGILNLGDSTANQQAILGTNYVDIISRILQSMSDGTFFLGNLGAPITIAPEGANLVTEYLTNKDDKYLSHHVNIAENNGISNKNRPANGQIGDKWNSTTTVNNLTTSENVSFNAKDGIKQNVDDPSYVAPLTDGTPDSVIPAGGTFSNPSLSDTKSIPDVDKLIRFMKSKNYVVYTEQWKLNIVGFRNKDDGSVSNKFDDKLAVFYLNENNVWVMRNYMITTAPGYKPGTTTLPDKVAVLQLGQYVEQYQLGLHQNKPGYLALKFANSIVFRNNSTNSYNYNSPTAKGSFGINIHHAGNPQSESVNNYSEGCQVFKNLNAFNEFIQLCQNQVSKANKKTFTYTLVKKSDYDKFS
jgi:hypothetical protein